MLELLNHETKSFKVLFTKWCILRVHICSLQIVVDMPEIYLVVHHHLVSHVKVDINNTIQICFPNLFMFHIVVGDQWVFE